MITIDPCAGTVPGHIWCRVCGGDRALTWMRECPERTRCQNHYGRDACCIEGCVRSTTAPKDRPPSLDGWFCGEHWKRFCPPRSLRRRAYHAFFRKAKRHGWDDELAMKYWRFWRSLVASARARSAGGVGHIDVAELERVLGPIRPEEIVCRG